MRRAGPDDRLPVFRMLELYQHDLSDIWDQDLDAHGEYGYSLDRNWFKPDGHPFVGTVNGRYAGFALVDGAVKVSTADSTCVRPMKNHKEVSGCAASAQQW